ncbi:MAG: hypothetical protein K9K62_07370 [Desulfobacteraceae bacterium]|nr:hypothetical protein [Desulfobacteraceae bacterium]
MNILPINNCESITTASTRTGKQQLRFALQLFPGRLCWAGDNRRCVRYRMEAEGRPHPDNMLPDGSIDPDLPA